MASREDAESALYEAIIEGAKAAAKNESAELVETLSRAYANVAHGPQGGDLMRIDNGTQNTHYRYESKNESHNRSESKSDYHDTRHTGEERRRPTGFGSGG